MMFDTANSHTGGCPTGRIKPPSDYSCFLQGETGPAGAPGPVGSRGGPVSDSTFLPVELYRGSSGHV